MRFNISKLMALAYFHGFGLVLGLLDGPAVRDAEPIQARITGQTTAYPTTITKVWSSTTTSIMYPNPAFAIFSNMIYITTMTVTLFEPWPSMPTVFPYTLVQTELDDMTISTLVNTSGTPTTYVQSTKYTVSSTWVLNQPAPTDLAAGTTVDALPCSECTPEGWAPDERCTRHNLDTACQGQCDLREGLWWCYKRYYNQPGAPVMGRVCWGNNDTAGQMFEYAQLAEPCKKTDHRVQCVPCKGLESNWEAGNWLLDP
ncbi:hypothetical protein AOQ84DRAFT_229440 [Glonium stellatum]|uniref:Uncharacterized protein n=1 Tax=Glonium stellatum TaxID=574774 RepID=A0A8E2EPY1_9PEZI|nr:hypothetical protein AOQ84DRAFT_229440 [Glonium stellatum]